MESVDQLEHDFKFNGTVNNSGIIKPFGNDSELSFTDKK